MVFSDPIADFLTRIRNAQKAQHKHVDLNFSKMTNVIAKILKEHGYIENFLVNENKKKMRIFLKYTKNRKGIIKTLKRISTPGRRVYVSSKKLPRVLGDIGIALLSTPKGVIDNKTAMQLNVGGEVLCYIW